MRFERDGAKIIAGCFCRVGGSGRVGGNWKRCVRDGLGNILCIAYDTLGNTRVLIYLHETFVR